VNAIGTFLLAVQLIPKLRETARNYETVPHMTFVGSALYDMAKYPQKHGDDVFAWFKNESLMSDLAQ
jgi:retinol dehydrogenase 12